MYTATRSLTSTDGGGGAAGQWQAEGEGKGLIVQCATTNRMDVGEDGADQIMAGVNRVLQLDQDIPRGSLGTLKASTVSPRMLSLKFATAVAVWCLLWPPICSHTSV